MATTVTTQTFGLSNLDMEIHHIAWEGTDATEEVTTGLSEIYAAQQFPAFGADAGHTDEDLGLLEIDETVTAGVITVTGGAITVNRLKTVATGTLADQQTQLILFGKS